MDFKHTGITKTASETQPLTVGPPVPALYANMQRHPTEKIGSQAFAVNQERRALQQMSIQYGSHMAQRTVIERNILAKGQRVYGRSSHFGLNSHMGLYEQCDFTDSFSDPYEQPELSRELPHSQLQRVYNL